MRYELLDYLIESARIDWWPEVNESYEVYSITEYIREHEGKALDAYKDDPEPPLDLID